jgi:adenosylcobyric acid synthase
LTADDRRGGLTATLKGSLMVCGTGSDAGKSTIVAGLCRLLARQGVRVAPFKAQNMALNSAVTAGGHEIGRAQAAQAHAAGVDAEVVMNPILLKPYSERGSQVVVMGKPWAILDAAGYQAAKPELEDTVLGALDDLRRRFDVVICEGAGSPAEINLLDADLVNLRLARRAGIAALLVGDIERGGVFAALYGTVELLPPELRSLIKAFVVNKLRGDPALLRDGPAELQRRCGVPTIGVLPWAPECMPIDGEDSLALRRWPWTAQTDRSHGGAPAALEVAAIRLPRLANFTDLDPLAAEPGVSLRLVSGVEELGSPHLVVIPGSKATVADLEWLRASGLADAIRSLAEGSPACTILGICAGYQMLGQAIEDPHCVESPMAGSFQGLGLLPTTTIFKAHKITARRSGLALDQRVEGYEIHHGMTQPVAPWMVLDGQPEGSSAAEGAVVGTSLHGLFEADGFRSAFLSAVAERSGRCWEPSGVCFAATREARFDRLAQLLEEHLDVSAVVELIAEGAPTKNLGGGR